MVKRSFSKVTNEHKQLFKQAAKALNDADAVYITAGAGMGVDSGLPDVCTVIIIYNICCHLQLI